MKKIIYSITIVLLTTSCAYESPDDFIEEVVVEEGENITYVSHVKTIIDNNCLGCHSSPPQNGAPMSLTSYNDVRSAVLNRDLIELISTQDLSEVMPLGGPRLPQHLIDLVIRWQQEGFIEQ